MWRGHVGPSGRSKSAIDARQTKARSPRLRSMQSAHTRSLGNTRRASSQLNKASISGVVDLRIRTWSVVVAILFLGPRSQSMILPFPALSIREMQMRNSSSQVTVAESPIPTHKITKQNPLTIASPAGTLSETSLVDAAYLTVLQLHPMSSCKLKRSLLTEFLTPTLAEAEPDFLRLYEVV